MDSKSGIPLTLKSTCRQAASKYFTLPTYLQVYCSSYFLLYWSPSHLLENMDKNGRIRHEDNLYHVVWHRGTSPARIKGVSQVAISFRSFSDSSIPPYALVSFTKESIK